MTCARDAGRCPPPQVNAANRYVEGVTYAIQKLGALPNVALYLDIGHSGCTPPPPPPGVAA